MPENEIKRDVGHILLERAERLAGMGSWSWRPAADELVFSDNLFRIFGLEPGEVVPSLDLIFERTHPDDLDHVTDLVGRAAETGGVSELEYRIIRPDRTVRYLRVSVASEAEDEAGRNLVGSVEDLTDRRRAEREIAAHAAAATVLRDWRGFEEGALELLREIAIAMDYAVGFLWLPDGRNLVLRSTWASTTTEASDLIAVTEGIRYAPGTGLPGLAFADRQPAVMVSVLDDLHPKRRSAALEAGLRGAVAFPAVHLDEPLVALEFYSREELELGTRLNRTLLGIGHELGEFLSHRRGQLVPPPLTPRELEILGRASEGKTTERIAQDLVISPATVKTHFENIYAKLGVSERAGAVAFALRQGLIE
jgi:DNA-binding NarL/FixJ family response regulator